MKKMKLTIAIIAMAALAAVGFSSCKTAKTTEACQHLRDTKWELEALNNKPIDTNTFITHPFIVFQEDGTFSGNLGCNTYFGSYYNKRTNFNSNIPEPQNVSARSWIWSVTTSTP